MRVIAFFMGCLAGFGIFWGITSEYFLTGGFIFLAMAGLLGMIIYDNQNKDD